MEAQPSRLRQARDWYFESVDAIPADGWAKSTLCEGWTARHLVAHVATGDQLFLGMLMDAFGKDRTGLDLPTDFADRRQRFEAMSSWEPARLKETARKASEETVSAIGDAARDAPQTIVNVPFGKVPIPVVRGLRLNEYIIHGHDLTPAIGRSLPIPDWFIDRALGDSINMMSRCISGRRTRARPPASTFTAPMGRASGSCAPRMGRQWPSPSTARLTSPCGDPARDSTGC